MKTKDVKIYAKSKQKNVYNDALAVTKAARDPELQTVKKEKLIDKLIVESNKKIPKAIKIEKIFGICPINAICLSNAPMKQYATPRGFAASLGIVPQQHTSGDEIVVGNISKQGDRYTRTTLIQAGRSIVIRAKSVKNPTDKLLIWTQKKLAEGKHFNLLSVAVANKLARIAHAIVIKDAEYQGF